MRRCHSILFLFAAALIAAAASAQTADLLVSKSAPESGDRGRHDRLLGLRLQQRLRDAQNVVVTDTLPAGTTFVSLNASIDALQLHDAIGRIRRNRHLYRRDIRV